MDLPISPCRSVPGRTPGQDAAGSPLGRIGGLALLLAMALPGCATQDLGKHVYLKQHRASIALTQILMDAEASQPELLDDLYATESALNKPATGR